MKKKSLRKRVKQWLKDTDNGDLKINFDNDYQFDESDDTISIGTGGDDTSGLFLKLYKKVGLKGDYNESTLSFLHELGHYNTYENFGDFQESYDDFIRPILYKIIESDIYFISYIGVWLYYHILPQEIEATRWGANYANENIEATKELDNIFKATR